MTGHRRPWIVRKNREHRRAELQWVEVPTRSALERKREKRRRQRGVRAICSPVREFVTDGRNWRAAP